MNKKTLLQKIWIGIMLFALAGIMNSGAWAQTWDAPTYKSEVPVSGTTYYVYNVGAQGFLTRGGWWTTQAVISPGPYANASSDVISWTINESGGIYTFGYYLNGTPDGKFLAHFGDWDVYGDGGSDYNWLLVETDATNHIFSIQNDAFVGSDRFLGWSTYWQWTNSGPADCVFSDKPAGGDNIKWKFISQDHYDLYQAKVLLDRYMKFASKVTGAPDLTTYITTYNSDITADINTAAANLLAQLAPVDVTDSIANPSFESGFDGWTNSYPFDTQTNTPPFSKDGNTYAEKWTWSGWDNWQTLANGIITQTITGLDNGYYELVVGAHAFQQVGSNPLHSGAFLKGNAKTIEVNAGDDYYIDLLEVSDGSLTIGFELAGDIFCNWTGFDNFRLYYYGEGPSSDATLSAITLSVGSLIPDFDPAVTSYYVTLPQGTASVDVSATSTNSYASINSGTGTITLTNGEGSTDILVTAEDGTTKKTYSLNFKVPELMHSYTFETDLSDVIGNADGTAVGGASVEDGALVLDSDGEYITFDGTELGLNSYTGVSLEFLFLVPDPDVNTGHWNYTYYFGGDNGSNAFRGTLGFWWDAIYMNNSGTTLEVAQSTDDGSIHHVVMTMSDDFMQIYMDGALLKSGSNNGFTIDETNAMLGKGWWGDPSWQGKIDEFNIYDGVLDPDTIAARAAELQNSIALLSSLNVNSGTLMPDFKSSTTHYAVEVPQGTASVDVTALPLVANAIVTGDGTIDLSGGPTSTSIKVTSIDGNYSTTYTVDFVIDNQNCYRPNNANIVPDPEITNIANFSGWGSFELAYGFEAYCGATAAKVAGNCGGSLNVDLDATGEIKPNTTYYMRAMVYVGGSGKFKIGFWGDGMTTQVATSTQLDEWEFIEMEFRTGESIGDDLGMYFNSCEGMNGEVGFIDNWELYDIESDNTDLISLSSPQGKISPEVYPSRDAYYLKYSINSVKDSIFEINAVPRFETATVTGTGEYKIDGSIMLVKLTVKSRSGERRFYWVQVEPNFDDASLISLNASTGFLYPNFDSEITDYELIVPVGTDSVEINAETGDPEANLTGTGTYYLANDSAIAEVMVTSRDSTNFRTYMLNIVAKQSYTLAHSYTFDDGTANDVIGEADGVLEGDALVSNGELVLSGNGYVNLPAEQIMVSTYRSVTIESVFTQKTGLSGFTVIYSFGNTNPDADWMGVDYFLWQPTRGDGNDSRTSISCGNYGNPWATESGVNAPAMDDQLHYAVTVITDSEIKLYIDGELVESSMLSGTNYLENISDNLAYIGASVYPGDPKWQGSIDEINIYEGEMEATTIAERARVFLGEASRDATLASLTIDAGMLSPVFDPETYDYFVSIPDGATSIEVNATANDANATVTGTGAVDVSSGRATASVVVTAEDGQTTRTYTIEFEIPGDLVKMHAYTFEDGTFDDNIVYDQVGSLDGTLFGDKISIADGKVTVAGTSGNTDGYIFFDGVDLALNSYSAITMEIMLEAGNQENVDKWTMLAYFGTAAAGQNTLWFQPARQPNNESKWQTTNNSADLYAYSVGNELDDGLKHHIVGVLNGVALTYYLDGVKVAEAVTNGADLISTIGTDIAQLYKGPDGWPDPNYNGSIHEFNIYEGSMDPSMVLEHSDAFLNASDARLSALTSDVGTVAPEVSGSATHYAVLVPEGTASVFLTATPYVSAATVSGDGEIDLSGGTTIVTISVTSADGTVTTEYTVDIVIEDPACASSLHPDNIVPDPEMTDLSMYAGWGTRIIAYGTEAYCGISSMKVQGSCGGSLDVDLDATGKLLPNTTYRMRAMVYVGGSGKFKIGWFGTATPAYVVESKHNDMWEMLDTTFTTGEDISDFGMYFNSCEGLDGLIGWIDNWEVFPVTVSTDAALADLTVDGTTIDGFDPDTMTYNVLLPVGTESTIVDALANDMNASVTGTGTVDLSSGAATATIVVTAEDGSTALTYTVNIKVDSNTAVGEMQSSGIKVYPTISDKEFIVAFDGVKPAIIKVYNIYGQAVVDVTATSAIEKINVPRSGIYLIRIETGGTTKVVKVIKTE